MKGHKCIAGVVFALVGGAASAAVYTFVPPSSNLWNLDHSTAYAWGLKPGIPTDEVITSAKLTITGIYDWQVETNLLTVDLLNTPPSFGSSSTTGTASNYVVTKSKGEDGGTYWEQTGKWGGSERMFGWQDADGPATVNTLVYDFSNLYVYDKTGTQLLQTIPTAGATLDDFTNYLRNDGLVGFGFDPNCHFYNSGVQLQIETSPSGASLPSPFAVLPFSVGLLVAFRRRTR